MLCRSRLSPPVGQPSNLATWAEPERDVMESVITCAKLVPILCTSRGVSVPWTCLLARCRSIATPAQLSIYMNPDDGQSDLVAAACAGSSEDLGSASIPGAL
ncbi:hypothetical protein CSOJ01_05458 [Colletotrichum sojae]|uniref:Uncharacterized protein n=1 Tax=Colletotrichum sojae TaxID=2175907 RepID=A0A8H6JF95_9PEZI|nr:hypothetical protein CSOJ01_05458 [Colletotrichum sojae]